MAGMRSQPQGTFRLLPKWAALFEPSATFVGNSNGVIGLRLNGVSGAIDVTPLGIAGRVTLAASATTTYPIGITVTQSWSLLMIVTRTVTSNYTYFFGQTGNSSPNGVALASYHNDTGGRAIWYDGTTVDSGFTIDTGIATVIGLTFDGATKQYRWYKAGRAGNVVTGTGLPPGGVWQFCNITNFGSTHQIPLLAISRQVITPADMLAATENPWQLFSSPEDDETLFVGKQSAITRHTLAALNAAQVNLASAAAVAQRHIVSAALSLQLNSASVGVLGQRHKLAGSTSAAQNTSSTARVAQHHRLVGAQVTQVNSSSLGAINSARHTLTAANSAQVNASLSMPVAQHHRIVASTSLQANTSSGARVGVRHKLAGAQSSQLNSATVGLIKRRHLLSALSSYQINLSSSVALGRKSDITALARSVPKSRWVIVAGTERFVVLEGTSRVVVVDGTNRLVRV